MSNGHSLQTCIVICPGIHDSQLTQAFLASLQRSESNNGNSYWNHQVLIFPSQDYPAYSTMHILYFLQSHIDTLTPLIFISFSAGVVGAIGAALGWQLLGGKVQALIAIDGWGVPLYGNFPIHRLSHDYFTYWSSALLGGGENSFYAEPAVEHLQLWQSPNTCQGWWVHPGVGGTSEQRTFVTAAEFVNQLLQDYQ